MCWLFTHNRYYILFQDIISNYVNIALVAGSFIAAYTITKKRLIKLITNRPIITIWDQWINVNITTALNFKVIEKIRSCFNILRTLYLSISNYVTIALEEGRLPTVFVKRNRRIISPAADLSSRNKLTQGINFKSFYYCLSSMTKTNIRLGILTMKNVTTNIVNRRLSSKANNLTSLL